MKHIVITGSTRGIGYGLAEAFLERGCAVTVSGRMQAGVEAALAALGGKYGTEPLYGLACDVRQPEQVQVLWDGAQKHFGQVDIWINNAGLSSQQGKAWLVSPEVA
ncbi:MAG TPA: SDR family NAD(P)-dependent oxidoreductase, partial [Anaerolineales bacterium]|nr:SDR family NAD(P)-dependent oxidoreductase [Anaerolineales bacterium]